MKQGVLKKNQLLIIPHAYVATSTFDRFLGLMGKKEWPRDSAILFPRCDSIHTFFMRFSIDVLLLNSKGEVIQIVNSLPPWRVLLPKKNVTAVVELSAGVIQELNIQIHDKITCEGLWP